MERKRIAVLIAQIEENTQNLFMQGLLEKAFALDYDVCTFSMYQKYQENTLREHGDSNIFNLIQQYSLFDAFVIMGDTIQTPGIYEMLEEQLHAYFNGPVVVIDRESRYFPTIMIDHYTPVRKLIDHLIEVHNDRDIAFLNGRPNHPHSIMRLQGYKDSLLAHGIPVREKRIFYGDFWYTSGNHMVDELLKDREHLPDAIACANDCMAIGICAALTRHGVRIPEDIAVIGYDSIEDGRRSPVPLTSADIPARECGTHCVEQLDSLLHGHPTPDFHVDAPLFIGGSCGCEYHRTIQDINQRTIWDTDISSDSFYSCFNHMMEDLLSQTTYQGFFNTVFQYTYQIRDFESFHLCLNDNWDVSRTTDDTPIRYGYSKTMCEVIRCFAEASSNQIDLTGHFDTADLLPELLEERDRPSSFIFTPLYFEDRGLGYAVISYGNAPKVYSETYRLWLRNVMQGLECFNRQCALTHMVEKMESTQVRDALTGLYNLRGFLAQAEDLCEAAMFEGKEILIVSIDMNGLRNINASYGRKEGDRAILALAQMITDCTLSDELCARMCNDEFLIACRLETRHGNRLQEITRFLNDRIAQFNQQNTTYLVGLCFGSAHEMVSNRESLEYLVNMAVADKNEKKALLQRQSETRQKLTQEDMEHDKLVTEILDHNRFIYHFQPIVSALTGEIFSYEALMRSNTESFISPLTIIKSAERLDRLYDIEKATFFNVLTYMSEHKEYFEDRKVFINSIPGHPLQKEDSNLLEQMLAEHSGGVVVELTEESELDDTTLSQLKEHYHHLNIDTAVDDYGAGYSNVNNLLRYMPRYVKIDRMLITDIQDNLQKQHFVRDIIEFAHDNNIMVLAEGVETSKELREVIRLGVDLIQGYYTARPQPIPLTKIDDRIVHEIVRYNQNSNAHSAPKCMVLGNTKTVPLVQLALNKITSLVIPGNLPAGTTIELVGSPGFQSELSLQIESGFDGTVQLHSVSFSGTKGQPCINLDDNVSVEFELLAENELRTGGIRVPENSKAVFTGDGNLSITINSGRYFGIGNDMKSTHGPLIFRQNGGITITTNGMRGVAIGSGLGGEIRIQSGWYQFDTNGQEGVCIGCLYRNCQLAIDSCEMDFHTTTANSVLIGSLLGDADITLRNTAANLQNTGNHCVGIGTLNGKHANITLEHGNYSFDLRSVQCIAVGGASADTGITAHFAKIHLFIHGKSAYAMGNYTQNASIQFLTCDITSNVTSSLQSDFGASEDDLILTDSHCSFLLNEQPILHESK